MFSRYLQKEVDKAEKEAFGDQDLQHLRHRNILKQKKSPQTVQMSTNKVRL